MDLDHLRELLQLVAASDVAEVEIEEDDLKIVVRKQSTTVAPPPQPQTITYAVPPAGYPAPVPAQGAAHPVNPAQSAPAHPAPAPAPPTSPDSGSGSASSNETEASEGDEVRAPIVGTFYRSPSPEAEPFVAVGDHVSKGDVLCIIEAMKLMNEIEAEVSGTIRKVLVEDATPVEYDQALFIVEPD